MTPETGAVHLIAMTEKQFQGSVVLSGFKPAQEAEVDSQLDIFL